MKQKSAVAKKPTRRRSRAQVEADRRLTALRKNLAKEIEADFDRFSGDKPSVAAGLMVLARMRIILAFLQAFFPMFISAPKPRKVKRATVAKRTRKVSNATKKKAKIPKTAGKKRTKAKISKNIRVVRLEQESPQDAVVSVQAKDVQSAAKVGLSNVVEEVPARGGKSDLLHRKTKGSGKFSVAAGVGSDLDKTTGGV